MNTDLFAHSDYKLFLNRQLDELDQGGRGARARLSRAIGCQTAYTAQVLRGAAHFSLEQAEAINIFLGHTEEQSNFFLLLVQSGRAGTPQLRSRFKKQLDAILEGRTLLKNRLGVKEILPERDQVTYYSSWMYGAVHALISIPGYQTPSKISERLGISLATASEALEFLLASGLAERKNNKDIVLGKSRIHLGADSPLIAKHHINWRLQAMRAIDENPKEGLHYSSVISVSKKDAALIKEKFIATINAVKPIIKDSKEEELCSLSLDFFTV